jgi:glycosyltransferase involved in cell wall biosynthesis
MDIIFSIVIPTYNREKKLKRVLDSLVEQTFKNFEVIICDDGSIDNTAFVVNSYTNLLQIKYIRNENWGGPARPRNIGITESCGEWICFLDSDDWWFPNKLEESAKYIKDYDFIYHSLDIYNSKSNKKINKRIGFQFNGRMLDHLLIYGNCIPNSSVLINRNILIDAGKFSENKNKIAIEDFDFWIRISQLTNKFKFINMSLGAYNWEDDTNISQISISRIDKEKIIFYEYLNLLTNENKKNAINNFSYKIGRYYYKIDKLKIGRLYLMKSLRSNNMMIKFKSLFFLIYYKLK